MALAAISLSLIEVIALPCLERIRFCVTARHTSTKISAITNNVFLSKRGVLRPSEPPKDSLLEFINTERTISPKARVTIAK